MSSFHRAARISYLCQLISARDLGIPCLHNGLLWCWSIMEASLINPLWSGYTPTPPPLPTTTNFPCFTLIYEWQNLTRGQLRWVAADHMIPALKSQARNVGRTSPRLTPQLQLNKKKNNNFDAPYHDEYPSQALICAVMLRRETGAAESRRWGWR